MGAPRSLLAVASALIVITGCTAPSGSGAGPAPRLSSPRATVPSTATPGAPSTATATASAAINPVSLPALMNKHFDGRDLRRVRVLARTDRYTRWFITYRSGSLRISGVMNIPVGKGPFPVVVLCHGYIDPAVYRNGQGLVREQDYLARHGYAVLHTDYRNHAQSDKDPSAELHLRLGYTEDVINAVLAVKHSTLPALDRARVGLLGRSMGGGVVYNVLVVRPGLVKAAVVFAPVSSRAADNFNRWIRDAPGLDRLSDRIITRYGAPERAPAFWRDVSAASFFDRVTEPVLIHHGSADRTCPPRWSRYTLHALRAAGKDARLLTYAGEGHAFGRLWPLSMRRTVAFLDQNVAGR
ncbi:MAG: alpha/beta hydrolase family protein [Actinomycetes bacterium]